MNRFRKNAHSKKNFIISNIFQKLHTTKFKIKFVNHDFSQATAVFPQKIPQNYSFIYFLPFHSQKPKQN